MRHNTEGLTRPCSATDIFLIPGGLQCGNCLAVERHPIEPADHIHQSLRDAIDEHRKVRCVDCGNVYKPHWDHVREMRGGCPRCRVST